jgi:hypothetical protein
MCGTTVNLILIKIYEAVLITATTVLVSAAVYFLNFPGIRLIILGKILQKEYMEAMVCPEDPV